MLVKVVVVLTVVVVVVGHHDFIARYTTDQDLSTNSSMPQAKTSQTVESDSDPGFKSLRRADP